METGRKPMRNRFKMIGDRLETGQKPIKNCWRSMGDR
jgi:hypothetical protein